MEKSDRICELLNLLHKNNKKNATLVELLNTDLDRFNTFSRQFGELLFDFSRTAVTAADVQCLIEWAELADLGTARERLFAGAQLNNTEQRAVLHPLWRNRNFQDLLDPEHSAECQEALDRMLLIAESLHHGELPFNETGTGERIRHLIHIGIGGSLLGPRLLCNAFPGSENSPAIHFISSVDAWERERLLASIDPMETAFVLVSKSFTTSEVLAHGKRLLQWQAESMGQQASAQRRFAVTAATKKAEALGVPPKHIMQMGEWTGGRFSLWSPVGLTSAISMGPKAFERLCAGGAAMDQHFREAPFESNLPVLHGLLSCWHRNICKYPCRGVIPYDSRLQGFPAWLQQVQMESNGKSVTRDGEPVLLETSPVVLGDCGTDAQHALFQAFHQGTEIVPLDFIGVIKPDHSDKVAQTELLSHLLAQASALAVGRNSGQTTQQMEADGKSASEIQALLPHRIMPGNRPANVLMLDALTPENLGMLLVLYEHSVFVESVIWDINAFDQWGVELGKVMAGSIERALSGAEDAQSDGIPGLAGLITHLRQRLND